MEPDGILRKLVEVLTQPLSVLYQQLRLIQEVLTERKPANVTPVYNKGHKGRTQGTTELSG